MPKDDDKLKDLKKSARDVLANMTPREAKVLRERFGIELSDNLSLEEIGQQFEVTRERITVIQEKALRKLRKIREEDEE